MLFREELRREPCLPNTKCVLLTTRRHHLIYMYVHFEVYSASVHKRYVTHIQPQNGEKQNIYLEVIYQKAIYPASMFMKPFADSVHPVSESGIVRGKH